MPETIQRAILDIFDLGTEGPEAPLKERPVDVQVAEDLPLVRIDPVLVEQALSQVIDNAAKYSPPGTTITIAARAAKSVVEIIVSDQGGLTAEEVGRLFERFYRGQRHRAVIKGSGLAFGLRVPSSSPREGGSMPPVKVLVTERQSPSASRRKRGWSQELSEGIGHLADMCCGLH